MYLCILNDGSATYFHPATGSTSALVLSICGPWLWLISSRYHLYRLFLTWRMTTLSSRYHLYRLFLTWRMTPSSRYHLYRLFLTWRMTTLFWCRFWNVTWIWPEMGRRRCLSGFPAMWALADSAAKDALVGDISVELIPFSDLKKTCKHILQLWQCEWDEFPENTSDISDFKRLYCLFSDKWKRRDCDSPIAHRPFFYHSLLFIEGWGTASVHRMW